jgi:glycine cleavage system H protein
MKKYVATHEWVEEVEDGVYVVGLTDYAQKELGDIVFVNLPEVGDSFSCGDSFSDVESVKAVSDIYAPMSGTVCEVNVVLLDEPAKINEDAENTWLVKFNNVEEMVELMDKSEYLASLS